MRRRDEHSADNVHELAVDFRVAMLRALVAIEACQRFALEQPGGAADLVLADPRRAAQVAETARTVAKNVVDLDRDLRILLGVS
jgi:hypothetical protein